MFFITILCSLNTNAYSSGHVCLQKITFLTCWISRKWTGGCLLILAVLHKPHTFGSKSVKNRPDTIKRPTSEQCLLCFRLFWFVDSLFTIHVYSQWTQSTKGKLINKMFGKVCPCLLFQIHLWCRCFLNKVPTHLPLGCGSGRDERPSHPECSRYIVHHHSVHDDSCLRQTLSLKEL